MKKILFISAFPPSTEGAGVKYTYNLINDLRKEYVVDLYFFENEILECKIKYKSKIKNSLLLKIIRCLTLPFFHPFFTVRFSISTLITLKKISKNYDIIYFDFSQVFIYSLFINHKNKFLMCHDIIYQKYLRKKIIFNYIEKKWIKMTEKFVLSYSNNKLIVFSEKDAELAHDYYKIKNTMVVDFYINDEIKDAIPDKVDDYFCFFGSWSRPENIESLIWFINKVLPKIPLELKFKIIGPSLPSSVLVLLECFPNIHYLGFVENPYPIIARSKALIAPIFNGAGVKVKCLESLLCGIPVIGTQVALEGIIEELLTYCKIVENESDFVSSIILFDENKYDRLMWRRKISKDYPNKMFSKYVNEFLN